MDVSQLAGVSTWAATYRERLHDLSWFMRVLNESIARMANAEDGCTGRFWEGRFKSQALQDEHALLTAMAYVDLNPIRAAIAETPEQSAHTSVRQRIRDIAGTTAAATNSENKKNFRSAAVNLSEIPPAKDKRNPFRLRNEDELDSLLQAKMAPFAPSEIFAAGIPFAFDDYLELVDTIGRAVHPAKRGFIIDKTPAILIRLEIEVETFIEYANHFLKEFGSAVGTPQKLLSLAESRQSRSLRGISAARAIFDGKKSRSRCMAAL